MITYWKTYKTLTIIITHWQTLSNADKHDHILKKVLHVSVYDNRTKRGKYNVDIFIILSNVISSRHVTAENAHLELNSTRSLMQHKTNRYVGNYDIDIAFRRF